MEGVKPAHEVRDLWLSHRELYVAVGTVTSHVNNIYRKVGAANRDEAVNSAREMRLLR